MFSQAGTLEVKDNSWAYELSDVDNSASASEEVEDPSSDNTPFEESDTELASEASVRESVPQGAGPSGFRPAASANVPRQRVPETAVTKLVWDTRKTKESNPISFTATSGFVKEPPADAGVSYFFEELWWLSKPGTYPQRETRGATSQRWRSLWDFLLEQSELYATQKQAGEVTPTVQAHKRFKDAGKHRAYESPSLSTMLRAHALEILHSAIRTTGRYQPWSTADLRGKFLRLPQIANVISSGKLQQFWRYFHAADNSNAEKKKLPTGEDNPNYDNLYKTRVVHDSFNANLVACYRPKQDVTIDESCGEKMEGKDGEGAAKCYNKDKPKQRHNKQYALNEASTGIPLWFEMHRSKENMVAKSDKGKMFDICQRLVTNGLPMANGMFLGHNLGTDNAYSSDQLAVWCKEKGLNFLGTTQLNRCDGRTKLPPTGTSKAKWVPAITVDDARGSFASATTKDCDVLKTGTDVFDQYLQQIENELTTYRPWMVHYKGLFREAVTTAHLYYREFHGGDRPLLDSSLELAEYFLERADELDEGAGRNQARFGHSFDGTKVCKPVWARYAEDVAGNAVPTRSSCKECETDDGSIADDES
ncbi:hypothetical protein CYMTET_18523 [Cymbomonas tetramitiformis]|uniref:PiggyBac transposable element-derived protein domain-containing protein n=1 Tax=Cymbomonas tetramitiformis TaxID=36881 RepID=A0AAE0L681_9CHLO|nr:hypothetical protein CYMTET_18523 [Cymbomonas tetramitiformis]